MHVNPNTRMDKARQLAKRAGHRIIGRPREQRDVALPPRCDHCQKAARRPVHFGQQDVGTRLDPDTMELTHVEHVGPYEHIGTYCSERCMDSAQGDR